MVAILVLDPHLRCDFINNVSEFMLGVPGVEAKGRPVQRLLWPGESAEYEGSPLWGVLSDGKGGEGEQKLLSADGRERTFAFRATRLGVEAPGGTILELVDLGGETGTSIALRESEQRLRLAVEATGMGIWDVDPVSARRRWSREFKGILGLPPDFEPDEDVFAALIHPDDREWVLAAYRRAYTRDSGGHYSAEFRIRRADSREERWVSTTGRIAFDALGQPRRGVGTLRDVNQRRRGEEALRESERRLRVALVAGRMGAWRYDLMTGAQQWDKTQFDLFGLDPSLPASRELFLSVVHPDDLPNVVFEMETLPVDTYLDSEFRVIRPDGAIRWISAHSIARAGPDGRAVEMIGVNRDMTAQKETEAALRISEERHRMAVEANNVGTWDYDMTIGQHRWSDQFRALWGLPAGTPNDPEFLRPLVDSVDWQMIRSKWAESSASRGAGRVALEFQHRRADTGAMRWAMVNGRIFFDEHERPVRAVGIMLDITERREAEERQRLILRELNHRVKNNLAVVQAIVSQTIRMSPRPSEAFERIQARLMAVSRTHDFLNMSDWGEVSLGDLLRGELEPYASLDPNRIALTGTVVRLDSQTALALGLVFHELATNAVKYGSLSVETGRLEVSWEVIAGAPRPTLRLDWIESSGPPVRQPRRRGFGSRLIDGSVRSRLSGTAEIDFARPGLRCRLTFPLADRSEIASPKEDASP